MIEFGSIAARLMVPAELNRVLIDLENRFNERPHDPASEDGREAIAKAIFDIEVLMGLMQQVIDNHLELHPDDWEVARRSLSEIARRLGNLRAQFDLLLPERAARDYRENLFGVALRRLADFVACLPNADWTVEKIDDAIAALIHPRRTADWQEYADQAEALRHRAVFELTRLRAKRVGSGPVSAQAGAAHGPH